MAQHASNPIAVREASKESATAWGTATTPAAGAEIVTIAAANLAQPGVYKVEVAVSYNATAPAAVEDGNWNLRRGATVIKRLAAPRALNVQFKYELYVRLSGSESLNLAANALATTGVVYVGALSATWVGN